MNTRINILYFLDSLLDVSHSIGPPDAPYLGFIAKDLGEIVERVVPETREGVLNLRSARQVSGVSSFSRNIFPISILSARGGSGNPGQGPIIPSLRALMIDPR